MRCLIPSLLVAWRRPGPRSRATLAAWLGAALALPLLLCACGEGALGPPRGLVVLDPEHPERPYFHDAGTLDYGQVATWTWNLQNTDREPVVIQSVTPACQCTRVKALRAWPADGGPAVEGRLDAREDLLVVPSGGRLEMVVSIRTTSIQPNVEKLAVLRINTSSVATPFPTFEIHVKASKPFLVKPAEIRLGDVARSHGGAASTQILTGVTGSPARLLRVAETTPGLEATLDTLMVNGEHVWTLTAVLGPDAAAGVYRGKVVLATTDEQGHGEDGRLEVDVWANAVADVLMDERLHFGVLASGQAKHMDVTVRALVPGMRVRVEEALLEGRDAALLSVSGIEPRGYVDDDGRSNLWSIGLDASADLPPGELEAELRVLLDDQQVPELRAEVRGVVR